MSKKLGTKIVLAAVHCDDPEDDELIREALIKSAKKNGTTVVV